MGPTESPNFGAWLRRMRESSGLTGYEVGARLDITARSVYNIENGLRSPAVAQMVRMAQMYRVDISEFAKKLADEHPEKAKDLNDIISYFKKRK